MRIIQVSTEFAPIAKAGGLGEVLVGLSRELCLQGANVKVILPKYDFIPSLPHLKKEMEFHTLEGNNSINTTMWSTTFEGSNLHLLETHHPKKYFTRNAIYGFDDDVPRFLFFAQATFEYLKRKNEPIDILHLHDWHAAALAPLLREIYPKVKIVLSIHNLEYQGHCSAHDLAAIGLKKEHLTHFQQGSHYNLLKGAIHYADAIVAVSPTYAKEILTPEFGFGLDPDLRRKKVIGILNGLDSKLWDPSSDPALAAHYSAKDSMLNIVEAKRKNRKAMLLSPDLLWFGTITRLVPQKGPFLIEAALREAVRQNCGFALLGSTQNQEIQRHFEGLKKEFANNPHVFIHLVHDEALAHRIFAALDFLVVPSLFEPCGLTQLVAMRYGTIPIVRATGGLKDTVFDCDAPQITKPNGFTFLPPTKEAVVESVDRAIQQARMAPASHQQLIRRGIESDFSWKTPARQYLELYKTTVKGSSH